MAAAARTPQITLFAVLITLSLVVTGCSGKKMMIRTARTILPDALAAFNDEPDWELARAAGFSNLKLLETLHRGSPEDDVILVTLAQAFGGVALAFLEDDMEAQRGVDQARFDEARQRAIDFYTRGQAYAGQALELRHPGILEQLVPGSARAGQALERLSEEDVPALFWYAFNQGGALWLRRDDPRSLTLIPVSRMMALRLEELDQAYFFCGPLLLLGTIDATLPPLLGGSLEMSGQRFRRAIETNDGGFLLARVLHARHYAVPAGDRELFENELRQVLEAPPDILPGYRLFTELARRRAERLIQRTDQLF